jgi:hypothetical protein
MFNSRSLLSLRDSLRKTQHSLSRLRTSFERDTEESRRSRRTDQAVADTDAEPLACNDSGESMV